MFRPHGLAAALLTTWMIALTSLTVRAADTAVTFALAFEGLGPAGDGFVLSGRDATRQLLVTGRSTDGQCRDLTRQVQYEARPDGVVRIDATGFVTPLREGRGRGSRGPEANRPLP